MVSEVEILQNQLYCLKKTYEEHQLIAQRYKVEYNRTERRIAELLHKTCSIQTEPECDT